MYSRNLFKISHVTSTMAIVVQTPSVSLRILDGFVFAKRASTVTALSADVSILVVLLCKFVVKFVLRFHAVFNSLMLFGQIRNEIIGLYCYPF